MKTRILLLAIATLAVPFATGAAAQGRPVNFILGGGYTAPNSEIRDHLGDGYNFVIGLQGNVTPVIGIEGLYSFNGLGRKRLSLPVFPTPLDTAGGGTDRLFADMNMQFGTANLVVQRPDGTVRPYGLVGAGVYYRPIKVTTPGVGFVPGYCDPFWYVCYSGGFVPTTNIVGERSSTDFGMDFGGGAKFGAFYAEARYHYIWGPTIERQVTTLPSATTSSTTDTTKANGQFFMMTFGVRF